MIKPLLSGISAFVIAAGLGTAVPGVSASAEDGEPALPTSDWTDASGVDLGPNVLVFDDSMSAADINAAADAIYNRQARDEFGDGRYALLFKPGTYDDGIHVNVGYYTQVAGLGRNPDDVSIVGGTVNSDAKLTNGNALTNFWRSIENLSIAPKSTDVNDWEKWAVSQAAPMRRVHVKGDLYLFDFDSNWNAGYASGGFMADTVVDGKITPASQQQWLSRNDQYGGWSNGVWNMVFVGDAAPPAGSFPEAPYTVVGQTPVMAEKPYLYIDEAGNYNVFVPSLRKDTRGVSWANGAQTPGTSVPLSQFYIAKPGVSDASAINAALSQGKNVLFTPGKYHLSDTIHVTKPNTIVMGLGLATLIPDNGQTAMQVDDVDGVKVAGLLLAAGSVRSPALMQVGESGSSADHSANPTFLYDVYFGVGGFTEGSADAGLIINSSDVVGDNFWIWRADHGAGAGWDTNPSKNGLIVNGDDVTIYGLFNEHHEEYQTVWNGNGGRLYFYQSEIPYDVQTQASWMSHGGTVNGYASYKIADTVTDHEAWGLGIYSYFRDAAIALNSAIEAPDAPGVKLHHITTIWLNGTPGSEITHVVNNLGGRVYANSPTDAMRQTITEYAGADRAAPTAPTGLTATAASSSQVSLTWAASSDNVGVEGYDVFRDGTKVGSTTTNTTSYTDSGLKAGTTYGYTVAARDTAGNRSAGSAVAYATTQKELVPYDRSDWTVTASKGDSPANMLDGKTDTRWTTGSAMAPGDDFVVDMKAPKKISRIVLNSGGDYARGYEVYLSNDGTDWGAAPAASGVGANPLTIVDFDAPVTAQYIKVVQTGTGAASWWSVYELSVFTDTERSLDRSGWTAVTTPAGEGSPANLFDGNMGTRWSSGTPMAPGQSIVIDLQSVQSFNKILLDSGSSSDYSPRFSIYVSSDGQNWGDPVVSRAATGPSILADFPNQNARYLKIVQEGTSASWWSIFEINVYQEIRNPIPVSGIAVSAADGSRKISTKGGKLRMIAQVLPENADRPAIEWAVYEPNGKRLSDKAAISEDGVLTAARNGTVLVVATAADGSGVSGSAQITITGQTRPDDVPPGKKG